MTLSALRVALAVLAHPITWWGRMLCSFSIRRGAEAPLLIVSSCWLALRGSASETMTVDVVAVPLTGRG
jgi:hypothetical protein